MPIVNSAEAHEYGESVLHRWFKCRCKGDLSLHSAVKDEAA